MADIATTRLDLRWAFGAEIADEFTRRYLSVTGRSTMTLAVWELVVSHLNRRAIGGSQPHARTSRNAGHTADATRVRWSDAE